MSTFGTRILAGVAIGLLAASPSWARVGVASVVDGEPKGLPPVGAERVLRVGIDMTPNERVTTGANDKAHIVFLDGSSLTVGPNSALTIDKFVYDSERKTGELALNASRGVFRFVGGAISKNAEVTIKTPTATVGIRGGIATFSVANNGATTANLLFGQSLTVTTPGGTTTLTQPGTSTQALGGNAPPTPPAPVQPGGPGNNNSFQQSAGAGNQPGGGQGNGPPGAGGGRPSSASIGAVFANSGLSRANSAIAPAAALAAVPATQQAQLKIAAVPAPTAAQQAGGPQQTGGPQSAAGSQQGSGPIQAAGLLQGASSLQGVGPMQGAGPVPGVGPLQGAGPILGAAATQAIGPAPGPAGLAGLAAPQASGAPLPTLALAAPGGPALTNVTTLNMLLANIMAGPNPPSPAVIALLVNSLTTTSAPVSDPGPAPPAPTPVSTTPIVSTTQTQISQPTQIQQTQVLPPATYNSTCQSQTSQTNC
ncbi:MAG: FecR domain-containing protein [Planctomycetota bacterium]